jgi:hypothetical protein
MSSLHSFAYSPEPYHASTQWDHSLGADVGDYGGAGDLQLDEFGEYTALPDSKELGRWKTLTIWDYVRSRALGPVQTTVKRAPVFVLRRRALFI